MSSRSYLLWSVLFLLAVAGLFVFLIELSVKKRNAEQEKALEQAVRCVDVKLGTSLVDCDFIRRGTTAEQWEILLKQQEIRNEAIRIQNR